MAETVLSPATTLEEIVDLVCRGLTLHQDHQLDAALASIDRALALAPDLHPCRVSRAEILSDLGRHAEALAELDRYESACGASPDTVARRDVLRANALADFALRLGKTPERADLHIQRGDLLLANRDFGLALKDYERALELAPGDETALFKRAYVLAEVNRPDEALAAYEALLAHAPDHVLAWFNRGYLLQQAHRLAEANTAFARAAELKPDLAEAYLEQGHCRLAQGDFAAAWPLYEWRWRTAQLSAHRLASPQPLWLGDRDPAGQTLLLWCEQGLGDSLQFVRLVPRVADLAARVILLAPAALGALLLTVDTRITVMDNQVAPLPYHDAHCPLMSLPLALGLDGETIPAWIPYLRADALRQALWQGRLGPRTRPRVGLVWAGRKYGTINRNRDLPLATLAALARPDVEFVVLQDRLGAEDQAYLAGLPGFRHFPGLLSDMAETAALIKNLDLVISVDTAVAHLAGALGQPCWLLLSHAAEWRWQLAATTSPWYPSFRLFRQTAPGRWMDLVNTVAAALASYLGREDAVQARAPEAATGTGKAIGRST